MNSDRPLRLALIGAGRIARGYELAMRRNTAATFVSIVDVCAKAAAALGAEIGCPGHATLDGALRSTPIDGAVVCTPPATHAEVCLSAVAAGIPVLCEKPLSVAAEPARRMIQAAERAGVLLAMASKFRFVEDVVRAKGMLASGLVGVPVLFANTFSSRVEMSHRWNSDPVVSGGGVIIDNGSHSADLARFLFGPVVEVTAFQSTKLQELEVEDTAHLMLQTAQGTTGHAELSWSLDQWLDTYLCVQGTEGSVRVGWDQSSYRSRSNPEWLPFGVGYDKLDALARQLDAFCASLRGLEPFPVSSEDALASVEVIDAAYASLERGRRVRVGAGTSEEPTSTSGG